MAWSGEERDRKLKMYIESIKLDDLDKCINYKH